MDQLRTTIARVVIAAFSLTALVGIYVLLADNYGETDTRILLTTFIVGCASVAALCYLTVADTRLVWLSIAGAIAALPPCVIALLMTWGTEGLIDNNTLWRTFGVGTIIAVTIAQVCVLVSVAHSRVPRALLTGTCAAATGVGVLACAPIIADDFFGEGYWRTFTIVAILDALGTVVVAAMGFGADKAESADDVTAPHAVAISAATADLLRAAAQTRGTTPDALADHAIRSYLDGSQTP